MKPKRRNLNPFDLVEQRVLMTAMNNLRRVLLDREPHIKEYYKAKKMLGIIFDAMVQYCRDGKYEKKQDPDFVLDPASKREVHLLESRFDLDTDLGLESYYDMLIYKTAPSVMCVTEDFIRNRRYKKPEKTEFLQSMLDSKPGLFMLHSGVFI
jgi:hypothetical protein